MIKTILFDYAGVLTPTKDKLKFAEENYQRFSVGLSELSDIFYKKWDLAATGKISEREYWNYVGEKLNVAPDQIRNEIYAAFPLDERVINIINQIKDKYTVVMVSNQMEDWLEKVIDDNNLREMFHYFANSYQIGISKPDKKIFLAALTKANSKPEETLFIDDSKKNIEGAKSLGIKTIQFENYEQFLKDFKKVVDF